MKCCEYGLRSLILRRRTEWQVEHMSQRQQISIFTEFQLQSEAEVINIFAPFDLFNNKLECPRHYI
jgi:hypothetical protein